MKRASCNILTITLLQLLLLLPAQAQPAVRSLIPVIESAESVFATAIQAYQDQDYATAARLFGVTASTFDLHRQTTAALLMRGKALYRNGDYQLAIQVLAQLVDTYPTSRYVAEARRVIEFANEGMGGQIGNDDQIIRLGILLPMNEDAVSLSQELFNGIRMAVEEFNAAPSGMPGVPRRKIRMIFRDTNNDASQAQQAIRDLSTFERVDAVIGPLFSSEAVAAAEEAQRSRLVMIAPLATEERVSSNRNFVFQANPTISMRGRLMARLAVRGLGLDTVGLLTDNSTAENRLMARGFEQEMAELDREIAFIQVLPDPRSWFRLADAIPRDTLLQAEALYLPINGGNAQTLIGGVLGSLERMGMGGRIRILGNVEWHNLPMAMLASNYTATYTNDFYPNPADSSVQSFAGRYQRTFGKEPQHLAYRGYDVTHFLALQLQQQGLDPRPLDQRIRNAGYYRGLGIRLDFTNGNVNEAMYFHRYRDGAVELLR